MGKARSIRIEDLEEHYSDAGRDAKNSYSTGDGVTYGSTERYTSSQENKYPLIAAEENNIGIGTMPLDKNNKNPLKTDGLNASEQGKNADGSYKTYEGTGKAGANGMTVKQTYYNLSSLSDLSSAYENNYYYNLFHENLKKTYWLASRAFNNFPSGGVCYFCIYNVLGSELDSGLVIPSRS